MVKCPFCEENFKGKYQMNIHICAKHYDRLERAIQATGEGQDIAGEQKSSEEKINQTKGGKDMDREEVKLIFKEMMGNYEGQKELVKKISESCETLDCVKSEIQALKAEIPIITQKTVQKELAPLENEVRQLKAKPRPRSKDEEAGHITAPEVRKLFNCEKCFEGPVTEVIKTDPEKFVDLMCATEECREKVVGKLNQMGYEVKKSAKKKFII